jgi:hypothetical protein
MGTGAGSGGKIGLRPRDRDSVFDASGVPSPSTGFLEGVFIVSGSIARSTGKNLASHKASASEDALESSLTRNKCSARSSREMYFGCNISQVFEREK